MGNTLEYNEHRIDEHSQVTLRILRDLGGEVRVSKLREESSLNRSEQIHYRVREHLEPAGLVEDAGMDTSVSGTHSVRTYRLTDEGREYVDSHEDTLMNAVEAARAVESITRMRDRVQEFDDRMRGLEDDVAELDNLENRVTTKISRMKTSVQETDDALTGRARVERVSGLESDLEELERIIEALQQQNREVDDRFESLEADVEAQNDRMESAFATVDKKLEVLYERISSLEEESS